jgi:hypothetical protein
VKHTPVTDAQYFEALSEQGLHLAEDQARQYLAEARQDEELPTRDVALGLAIIQTLKTEQVTS